MEKILITGISSGIGKEITKICLKNNMAVTGVVRKSSQKKFLEKELKNPNLKIIVTDLSNKNQVKNLISKIKTKNFDFVLLNAGFANIGKFHKLPESSFEKTLETNLMTNIRITHSILKKSQKTKFIFISSLAARYPGRNYTSYSVSKAALSQFHHSLSIEYPKNKFLVLEIGAVKSEFHKKAGLKINNHRFTSVQSISKKIFKAILEKEGVKTLYFKWYMLRKILFYLNDTTISLLKIGKK